MARHVDDLVSGRDLLELVEVMHRHAAIDLVPERRERERERAYDRVRIIGRDFHREAMCASPGLRKTAVVAPRLVGDRASHRLALQHAIDEGASMRQVRSDDRGADAAEVRTQHARELAYAALRRHPVGQCFAQADRRRESHDGVAAIEQHGKEAPEAADHRPVFDEQHAEPAFLPIGCATDEDRHRHDLHVARRIGLHHVDQARKAIGVRTRARSAEPVALTTRQRDQRTTLADQIAGAGFDQR